MNVRTAFRCSPNSCGTPAAAQFLFRLQAYDIPIFSRAFNGQYIMLELPFIEKMFHGCSRFERAMFLLQTMSISIVWQSTWTPIITWFHSGALQSFSNRVDQQDLPLSILQGMLRAIPDVVTTTCMLHQLWLHECTRVFADKLNSQEDRQWFTTMALGLLETSAGSLGLQVCLIQLISHLVSFPFKF